MSKVTKAIIPAAGYGTRLLPIAKSIPKEMLPIVDKPVVQYVVEEAVASGITDILFIISRGKRAIEEYFHSLPELENELRAKGKSAELESVQRLNSLARIQFVWQQEMRGLGDAVLHARSFVGDDPFAIMLGDCILESAVERPVLGQLIDEYSARQSSVVALQQVPLEKVSRYGIAGGEMETGRLMKINTWVEKPSPESAPSQFAVSARYLFTPTIFQTLAETKPGKGGEIQLTDAMRTLLEYESTYGLHYAGQRHDIGSKVDFLKANIHYGLQRQDTAGELRKYLEGLQGCDPLVVINEIP
jgi:UTP--glucose-1-phosphate uridylyltransferase